MKSEIRKCAVGIMSELASLRSSVKANDKEDAMLPYLGEAWQALEDGLKASGAKR